MKRLFILFIVLAISALSARAQKITLAGLRVGAFHKGTEVVAALGDAVAVSSAKGVADLNGDGTISPTYSFTFANGCRATFLDGGYLASFNVPCRGITVSIDDIPFSVGQYCGFFVMACGNVSYDGERYINDFGPVTMSVKKDDKRNITEISCTLN